eukprot:SAG31_NODE_1599_length_7797_cov_10.971291_4_plen_152_part_00
MPEERCVTQCPKSWTLGHSTFHFRNVLISIRDDAGIENADSSAMGCYAMQPTDYDDLKPFFAKVLAAYHGVEEDAVHRTDWDLGGDQQAGSPLDLDALGVPGVSMRVRVGRNLEGFPLPGAMTVEDRVALEAKMKEVFDLMILHFEGGILM